MREVRSFSITSRNKALSAKSGPQATTWIVLRSGEHHLEVTPPNLLGANLWLDESMPVLDMDTNALRSSEGSRGHISAPPDLLFCEKSGRR